MLAISNLNSIESKTLIDEEKNYLVLKESIRMMKTRRSDTEKSIWLKKAKEKTLMILLNKMHEYETMLSHCLKFKTYGKHQSKTILEFPKLFFKTTNVKTMLSSKCAKCCSLKSKFIKKQEGSEILSSLGLETPLSKVLLFGDILFWIQFH